MKFSKIFAILLVLTFVLSACGNSKDEEKPLEGTEIVLSDSEIKVDGEKVTSDKEKAVYVANDIVYYQSGKDFTYGEGSEKDAHSQEEADSHTVVHITKAGTYKLSGKLSKGQIAIDLGDGAKKDKNAVVTLVLEGVDISCSVAPAVIFYNVYECGDDDEENATKDVDTSSAGANVIIADGSENKVNGSYVARIYEPDSVQLNQAKTEVVDADKLHKYDGAFYSKRSMNINGGKENTGVLNIKAENEGLDSELHLTINGGNINIVSGNDGINTNEDGISVTAINGGNVNIKVSGETGEGDGIDSNGWLVINGGTVVAQACAKSADAGIDSDMGIHINGGKVIATGSMLDRIENGGQNYAVFNFAQKQKGGEKIAFKNENGENVFETTPENAYSILIYSSSDLKAGTYTLWSNDKQLQTSGGTVGGNGMKPDGNRHPDGERPEMPDGERPEMPNGERPEMPNGERPQRPEGTTPPEMPEGATPPEMPEGTTPPEMPEGTTPPEFSNPDILDKEIPPQGEPTTEFVIKDGGNMFGGIS